MARPELLFKAMADTTRQRLLRILASHDLTVSELVEVLDQPQSTVSRHLKILRESGLVVDRRAGNTVHYAALPPNPLLQAVQPQGDEAGTIGRKNGGQVTELRDQLLAWLACCELEEPTRLKLEHVLARRRAGEQGFFEVVGARWDQLRIEAFGESFHLEALTALLPTYWVVADIGTGTGYLLGALANRFNRVIAVDPAKAMLDVARQRPELKSATNVVFRQGSLDHLPLGDGEADLAIASLVLHHVEEPEQALAELARCLRPAGRLLIIEQEAHRLAEFHERMGDRWWGFEPQALVSQVEAAGFAEVDTQRLRSVRPANNGRIETPSLFVLAGLKVGPEA